MSDVMLERLRSLYFDDVADRIEELQAKLAKALETLQTIDDVIEAKSELFSSDLDLLDNLQDRIRTTLAELKGKGK